MIIPYRERLTLIATQATHTLSSSLVRYGYKRTIERVLIANKTAARGTANIYLAGYGYGHYIDPSLTLSQAWQQLLTRNVTLREEEYIQIDLSGLTDGDNIEVLITGYDEPLMSS